MRHILCVSVAISVFASVAQGPANAAGIDDARAGIAAFRRGDIDGSIQLYTKALDASDLPAVQRPTVTMNRGWSYLQKKDFDSAITDFNEAIRLQPALALAYLERGMAFERQGKYELARVDLDVAIRLNPMLPAARAQRAMVNMETLQYDRAITDLDVWIALKPDDGLAYDLRGNTEYTLGKLSEALTDEDRAIELRPDDPNPYVYRARIYGDQGDLQRSLKDYEAALKLQPNYELAYSQRANTYAIAGHYDQAMADYDKAIDLKPDDAIALTGRGVTRFALARYGEATDDLAQSMKLAPLSGRLAWLFIVRSKVSESAASELTRSARGIDRKAWPGPAIALYLAEITPDQFRSSAAQGDEKAQRDQACEGAFYLGEYELMHKNMAGAEALFRQAVATCSLAFYERIGATAELQRSKINGDGLSRRQ